MQLSKAQRERLVYKQIEEDEEEYKHAAEAIDGPLGLAEELGEDEEYDEVQECIEEEE